MPKIWESASSKSTWINVGGTASQLSRSDKTVMSGPINL